MSSTDMATILHSPVYTLYRMSNGITSWLGGLFISDIQKQVTELYEIKND